MYNQICPLRLGRSAAPVLRALLVCSVFAICLPVSVRANTIYSYSGNSYTSCSGSGYAPPCTPYKITGSFALSLSLSSLGNLNGYIVPNADITALSFSDGSGLTINLSNATLVGSTATFIDLWTNSAGQITNWIVGVAQEPTPLTLGSVANNITTIEDVALTQDSSVTGIVSAVGTPSCPFNCVSGSGGSNQNAAGVWSAPVVTPEPTSLILCGTGLLSLAGMTWRRKRA